MLRKLELYAYFFLKVRAYKTDFDEIERMYFLKKKEIWEKSAI